MWDKWLAGSWVSARAQQCCTIGNAAWRVWLAVNCKMAGANEYLTQCPL